MSLSERIRPNCEAAQWVIDEVKEMENRIRELQEEYRFIHTVTAVPHHPNDNKRPYPMPRCWGFYNTREEAIKGLHASVDDEAGYYNYAVIERFREGIYTAADHELWFKYDFDNSRWVEIPTPEFATYTFNYGIG